MKHFSHRPVVSTLGLLAIALISVLAIGSKIQAAAPEAQTRGGQMLHGHVPAAVGQLQAISRLSATNRLHLAFGLPLRNQDELGALIHDLYDPASPIYRHYLTREQFTERFGPSEQDYQAVIDFAKSNGLTVVETHPNRVVLVVEGAVSDIERTLHVTMRNYQHPKEARTFYAPDVEPSLDLAVPILHISGLDNYAQRVSRMKRRPTNLTANVTPNVVPNGGSGPIYNGTNTYIGGDFRQAYVPGTSLTGTGQNVGLLQYDGYFPSDITSYITQAGITTSVTLTNIMVGPAFTHPGSGNGEVSLDITMVISMAPGVSKIYVYEATNDSSLVSWSTLLSRMADDTNSLGQPLCRQLSCSWGDNSAGSPDPVSEGLFQQMATQGQSFFNATGDSDAFSVGSIPFPSESTNITQVGATSLTTGSGATYTSEAVWNWGGGTGSSGGVSGNYNIPDYQVGITTNANKGSLTKRNVPDVALTGDNVYNISDNGATKGPVGGTSCAAPLWAGFMALVNEQATNNALPSAGFINRAVYTIGFGPSYSNCFHDVTTGNNYRTGSTTRYPAVSGYDLCTGWGTPNGTNLINALAGPTQLTPILSVSPATGLASSGNAGGAFSPGSQSYVVSDTGTSNLNWTVSKTANWLSLSATSGSLAAGGSTNVTASINANANSLSAGSYSDTLSFSNTVNGTGNTTRSVTLTVNAIAPVIVANGWTLTAEGCAPTNHLVDPGETVTVSLAVTNIGTAGTGNLVGTLLATNGVTSPSSAQTYGVVATGASGSRSFTFTANGTCGGSIIAALQLQDGSTNYGNVTYTIPLGQIVTDLSQNFDGVTAPALPSGWATSATGGQSNWVTSTASAYSSPNAAFSADNSVIGVNELDSPSIAISSASAQLSFRQNYSLTASTTNTTIGYDGGVLEIKIGAGSYTDILSAGGSFASGGYNTTLASGYSNPLAGRQAWSGNSGGFTTTVVNLPAAAASQNVQLRWRCGTGNLPPSPRDIVPLVSNGTLAYWSFDASSPNADVTGSNITVAAVTVVNTSGSLTYFGGNPSSGKAVASSGFTTASGPPSSSYSCFAFSITVAGGYQLGLSSLSFDDRASGTGPATYDVQVSTNSFASVLYDSGAQSTHSSFSTTPMDSFSLTNSGLTGAVYFRIYGYAAGGGTWRIDNVNVQGSVGSAGPAGPGGWYIDSVSISDPTCCSGTVNPLVASFTGSPTSGTAPLNVTFTDTSTGAPTNWAWDFGDGGTSTVQNPTHSYAAGTYTVRLIASNTGGSSTNTQSSYITALTPYQAWQIQYFGSLTNPAAGPDADPFGKGISNTNQFLMGLNPTNVASVLRIVSVVSTGSDVVVTWQASGGDPSGLFGSGKTDVVEVTAGQFDGSYSNNFVSTGITNIITTLGDIITNAVDAGGATNVPSRYYRIHFVSP